MKRQTLVLQGRQSWHGTCLCQGMPGIAPGMPVPVPKEFPVLTDRQRAIVQSTVPLLETGGEALITHFYQTMLGEYPEVRALFSMAHQQSGAQPRALADRKSTRLNSSHQIISYAVFCLKKKKSSRCRAGWPCAHLTSPTHRRGSCTLL